MGPAEGAETSDRITVDVLGVEIDAVDLELAVRRIAELVHAGNRSYVCVTGMHGVMESKRDPCLRDVHNRAALVVPDGMPMAWAGRLAGAREMRRVAGPDLMRAVCGMAAEEGWRLYFYGGSGETLEALGRSLRREIPGIAIVGFQSPPFRVLTSDEEDAAIEAINAAKPDVVWVGLGTPKQERWMARQRKAIDAPLLLGVGAAFDFQAGLRNRAPRWMRASGLEWLYRLCQEPRRLWRRYLLNIPVFIAAVVLDRPKLRRSRPIVGAPAKSREVRP